MKYYNKIYNKIERIREQLLLNKQRIERFQALGRHEAVQNLVSERHVLASKLNLMAYTVYYDGCSPLYLERRRLGARMAIHALAETRVTVPYHSDRGSKRLYRKGGKAYWR